ncbi:MAG TPA: helix-turn-helix domain-containing protein [Pusillimonas sp.]|uniref:MarR family winged helix-turn-helix transcriptional regulator n=1 Tax=unclassified Pusillimonas TaxID=2640016 RepID=UPI0026122E29|nr:MULTISPECIES: helix-turn-helix domain-containing protein [unclassified Pusillimonas]HLU19352.1 helix-turn-helix domain-containing protein [Pusillimonas sp.]
MSSTQKKKQGAARVATGSAPASSARPHAADPSWRRENIGRLLNEAIARFESNILRQMEEAGYHGFSLSHITVTRNLDLAGTRATELARRAGITKQSISELINQLEAGGIVQRKPDPADGRAKIVTFTQAGLDWLEAFGAALRHAEEQMATELGHARYKALKESLKAYTTSS